MHPHEEDSVVQPWIIILLCTMVLWGVLSGWMSYQDITAMQARHAEEQRLHRVKSAKTLEGYLHAVLFNEPFKSYDDSMLNYTSRDPKVTDLSKRIRANLRLTKSSIMVLSISDADYNQEFEECLLAMSLVCQVFVLVHIHDSSRAQQLKDAFFLKAKATLRGPLLLVPSHRMIFCSSRTGRMAAARQLQPDLVVEYDSEIAAGLAPHVGTCILVTENSTTTQATATHPPGVIVLDTYKNVIVQRL